MPRSMTGFGRGQVDHDDRRCVVEIRTVNSKYFDLQIRVPRVLYGIENRIREMSSASVARGKTEIFVSFEDHSRDSKHVICDMPLVYEYEKVLKQISAVIGSDDRISASVIARFNDVLTVSYGDINDDQVWDLVSPAVARALESLTQMREIEGKALTGVIEGYLGDLSSLLSLVRNRAPMVTPEFAERLKKRISDLSGDLAGQYIDEQRMAFEISVFADKCSVDEEITRLQSHISQFSATIREKGTIGKKLDFIIQEINREINTIGSKANDVIMTGYVVEMKNIAEKIREQIQNIE